MIDKGMGKGDAATGAIAYIVIVFNCIGIYNVIELTWMIWTTFKRHSGLYFWSFNVATYGIALYALAFILDNKAPHWSPMFVATCIVIGWPMMVTGQSMVLYSRLHLVVLDRRILRAVLGMIVVDAIVGHIPTFVFIYGANSDHPDPWLPIYSIYEKIQLSIFFTQETIISALYIAETVKTLRLSASLRTDNGSARRLLKHLILINIIIILMDVVILGLEYASRYTLQTSYKTLVYSVKLKMEFSILNGLVKATKAHRDLTGSSLSSGSEAKRKAQHSALGLRTVTANAIGFPVDAADQSVVRRPGPVRSYRASIRGDTSLQSQRFSANASTEQLPGLPGDAIGVTKEVVVRSESWHAEDGIEGFATGSVVGGELIPMAKIEMDLRNSSQIHLSLASWPDDDVDVDDDDDDDDGNDADDLEQTPAARASITSGRR